MEPRPQERLSFDEIRAWLMDAASTQNHFN